MSRRRPAPAERAFLSAACLAVATAASTAPAADAPPAAPGTIPWVQRMPRLPEPLVVRDWADVSRTYYDLVFDPATLLDGKPLVIPDPKGNGFLMPSYLPAKPADEAITCLSAVVGAKLAGLNPRALHGVDWVQAAKAWYDDKHGIYRHTRGDRSPVVHADIYGYWEAIQGMMIAAQHPEDADLQKQLRTAVDAFLKIAKGMGCPDKPDFDVLGFNFNKGVPEGRPEPMNRLGHAPSVAWPLLVGFGLTGDRAMLDGSRSAMQWYADHPGRYEVSHLMGPLTAARLNAEHGAALDLDRVLAAWFGDGDMKTHPWAITAGMRFGGFTCDGLDGARWGKEGFHAFSMGTLQGPAWLVPVVRYAPRTARDVGRYALHAAVSSRLLQGHGLDGDRQDHKDWKDRWDPGNLLFYEAMSAWDWSDTRTFRPYATGDPIRLGWNVPKVGPKEYTEEKKKWFSKTSHNLSLYMGNHVGFLGGIVAATDVPGILRWDCVATDWFHPPAHPTFLYYNPHDQPKTVGVALAKPADLYDLVAGRFVARGAPTGYRLTLAPDQAVVLVAVPPGGKEERDGTRLQVGGVVVDYRAKP
jgi:hypothetical protein